MNSTLKNDEDLTLNNSEIKTYDNFDDMELNENLLRGIYAYGFEIPSSIQSKAIVEIKNKNDIIAQAQSGTGKTAAFTIGILNNIDIESQYIQGIILLPTRELAEQVYKVSLSLSKYMNVDIGLIVGGSSISNDIEKLRKGQHIIIGTPGRIYDMIKRNELNTYKLKTIVLDEADEMLSKGFQNQIYDIFCELPQTTQALLFSATIPNEMMQISEKFMRNPKKILVKRNELTLEGIKQFYILLKNDNWKFDTILDIYDNVNISQSIIYCNKKKTLIELASKLQNVDFQVSIIHGSLEQSDRTRIMDEFRRGESRIIISTDLLARGIDVQGISLVINYDIPSNKENYIHRIGRSGRYGRKGIAINLITPETEDQLNKINKYYNTEIEELPEDFKSYF